jgi:hypothetical protein
VTLLIPASWVAGVIGLSLKCLARRYIVKWKWQVCYRIVSHTTFPNRCKEIVCLCRLLSPVYYKCLKQQYQSDIKK